MRTIKFISIFILLCGFTFALVQCTKDENGVNTPNPDKTIELRESSNCIDTTYLNSVCSKGVFSWAISLPQYPGCTFWVDVPYYFCYGLTATSMHVGDYKIVEHDCQDYNDDANDAFNNGMLEIFTINFDKSVWHAINVYLMTHLPPQVTTHLELNYYTASCAKTCYVIVGKPGEIQGIIPHRYNCGEKCCKLITVYRKINGVWKIESQSYLPNNDPCTGSLSVICPRGTTYSTDCIVNCDGLRSLYIP